jgi:hypothetical protein
VSEAYKSALETIRAKYEKTETVCDGYGRIITVRRLNTPQQTAVREMSSSSELTVIGVLTMGASVAKIDDIIFPFPKNRADLDLTLGVLDDKGLEALFKAYQKFNEESEQETIDAAKNSPGMSS